MDKLVVIKYTNSLEELDKQRDEYNSLTYREKKLSDMEQVKQTGLYNADVYNLIKNNIDVNTKVDVSVRDPELNKINEDFDIENMYNKSKFNSNRIEKEISKCKKELQKNKDNPKIQNRLEYLECIKKINNKDNTGIDRIYLLQFYSICKLKIDKKEKLKYINNMIKDLNQIILNYDIAISYMYKKDKIEDGIKKITEVVCNTTISNLIGPSFNIIQYAIKRNNTRFMIKLKSSISPQNDIIKEKEKLENTLEIIKTKKKAIEKGE